MVRVKVDYCKDGKIVGSELIDKVIDSERAKEVFWKSCSNFVEKTNIREDENIVEMRYMSNYFGIEPTKDNLANNENTFAPLVQNRLSQIDLVKEDLRNRFMERFPQISNRLK